MQVRKVSLSTGELSYFASGEGRPLLYLHPAGGVRWTRVLEGPAGLRPKGKGERPADAQALRKLLFLHPEKLPPESRPLEQEVANRRMLLHYGTTLDTDEELLARLPSIDKLTLILHGTADRMIPKESVQLLKGRLPRSYLVYVWDSAHAIEVDQPERMLSLVENFLQRSEGFMVNWGTLAVNPG